MENVLVGLIIGLAGFFLGRNFFGKVKAAGKGCGAGGCCGCGAHGESAATEDQFESGNIITKGN